MSPCNDISIINESYPLSLRVSLIYLVIYIIFEWVTLCHYFLVGEMCLPHCLPEGIMIMLTTSCKCNPKLRLSTVTRLGHLPQLKLFHWFAREIGIFVRVIHMV